MLGFLASYADAKGVAVMMAVDLAPVLLGDLTLDRGGGSRPAEFERSEGGCTSECWREGREGGEGGE